MEDLLNYYLSNTNPTERQRLLLNYPVLLSPVVDQILSKHNYSSSSFTQFDNEIVLLNLDLITECRNLGIDVVFPNSFPYELKSLPKSFEKETILIPAGKSYTGSNSGAPEKGEYPIKEIFLPNFYIDKYPITNAEYSRFVIETEYPIEEKKVGIQAFTESGELTDNSQIEQLAALLGDIGKRGFVTSLAGTHPNYPVTEISWHDAVEFCRWARKRLPTAEEWEKAARGNTQCDWSWGNEADSSKGNTLESKIGRTTDVSSYDNWASPYGCCDMSANVMEWTSSKSQSSELLQDYYVIKGGCWIFSIDEAQVWKLHDNPPTDLWDALGFRCCTSKIEIDKEQLLNDYDERNQRRLLENLIEGSAEDDPSLLGILQIVQLCLSGKYSLEESKTFLLETTKDPRFTPEIKQEIVKSINKFVNLRTVDRKFDSFIAKQLFIAASLGVHLATATNNPHLISQARFALGKANFFKFDWFQAIEEFEQCLEYYRSNLHEEKEFALTLLALGVAYKRRNLTMGEKLIDVPVAQEHLLEALSKLQKLGMKKEEQEALCALAEVQRLSGQPQDAFEIARKALSLTNDFSDTIDEINGIFRVGEVFLNIHRWDYAKYCFKTAHRLASLIADTELITEASIQIFLLLAYSDKKSAVRHGAETFETIVFFQSDQLQRALNVIFNTSQDKIAAYIIGSLLGNLVAATQKENFNLSIVPLIQCAIAYAFKVPELMEESAFTIASELNKQLSWREEFFLKTLLTLAYCESQPETAGPLVQRAAELAKLNSNTYYLVTSRQIRIEVLKELGAWDEAVAELEELKRDVIQQGQADILVAYLEYEANLYYWSGNVSAALEACDEATIEAHKNLDPLEASRATGNIHILRSEIFSKIGSQKALTESELSNSEFAHSGDRLGSAKYMVRQAQVFLDPNFDPTARGLRKTAELLQYASNLVGGKTLGMTDEELTCELIYTIGLFYLRTGDFENARTQFESALEIAGDKGFKQLRVSSLVSLAEIARIFGDQKLAEEIIRRNLTLARDLKRPFETLEVIIQAGFFYIETSQLSDAEYLLREALEIYKAIRKKIKNNPIERKTWLRKNSDLFDLLINRVFLNNGRDKEAFLLLQEIKTSSLNDLLSESRLVSPNNLSTANASLANSIWRDIRLREIGMEKMYSFTGNEMELYNTRLELVTLRKQLREFSGVDIVDDVDVKIMDEDMKALLQHISVNSATTIVDFFVSPQNVTAFILSAEAQSPISVQLSQTHGIDLERLVEESFIKPYRVFTEALKSSDVELIRDSREAFFSGIEIMLSEIPNNLFTLPGEGGETILEVLEKLQTEHLILIPSGILSILPLQALKIGTSGEAAYLLENFKTVTFAPSLSALKLTFERSLDSSDSLLAIQNPDRSLSYADNEVRLLKKLFSNSKILMHEQARKETVVRALDSTAIIHFGCHGSFYAGSPLDSGLLLADAELTLAEIYASPHLKAGCHVTLASCESGLIDLNFADEFLGFPSGFIFAGASSVLSTLWVVNDLSTMLIMEKFYINYLNGMPKSVALKEAQLWLRNITAGELADRFENERNKAESESLLPADQLSSIWRRFVSSDPEIRPFEHPFYWAAFTLNGH